MNSEAGEVLSGRRILVTRAEAQSRALVDALRARGAEAVVCPLVRGEPAGAPSDVFDPADFDWLVVTSPGAVGHLRRRLSERGGAVALPPALRVAVVGPGTADAVQAELGHATDLCPPEATGAGLARAFRQAGIARGSRVLRVRGEQAADDVEATLRELGAVVQPWTIYRTVGVPPSATAVDLLRRGGLDAVVFASGSAVRAYAAGFGEHGRQATLLAACIGPVTARIAADHGWRRIVTAASPAAGALIAALARGLAPAPGR